MKANRLQKDVNAIINALNSTGLKAGTAITATGRRLEKAIINLNAVHKNKSDFAEEYVDIARYFGD
jgi:hypothetical protein